MRAEAEHLDELVGSLAALGSAVLPKQLLNLQAQQFEGTVDTLRGPLEFAKGVAGVKPPPPA
jgi:hypothetical protein